MLTDLRYAFRQLRKSPGFTFVAIFTLALGIGANTSIFSVVNAVLLRPLPYPEPDRLVILGQSDSNQPSISVSFQDYLDYRRDNTVFEQLAIARREPYSLSGIKGREPEQIVGGVATANFFRVIGLTPQIGRVFSEEEDRVGGPKVAVISDKLWGRVFSRNPNVLGRVLTFNGQPYTVIGVMPPKMFSPRLAEAWFPLMQLTSAPEWQSRGNHQGLFGWGRLKAGVSLEKAQAEMTAIAARLERQYPESNTKVGAKITPLIENQVGEYRSSLTLLLCAVGVVLLIACANLANLLAARGAARSREFAIRVAIGARRWQIIRQLLIESLLLAIFGGALGFGFAAWGIDLLMALAPPDTLRFQETRLDGWVLAFTALLSLVTSVLFGLWPAWHISRADAQTALKAGAHGASDSRAARRSRELLIIAEVALTLILLSTTALVLKSFANTVSLSLGFESRNLFSAQIALPSPAYDDSGRLINFSKALLDKLRTLPGVEHAALAANPPLMTGWQSGFVPEGIPKPAPGRAPSAELAVVMGDYFQTLQTPLLRGRSFSPQDTTTSQPVIIIDQLLATRYFPGKDPIGKGVQVQTDAKGPKIYTIVGVVPHLKVYGFGETNELPQGYFAQTQVPMTSLVVLLRSSLPVASLEKPVRQIVSSIDPAQPIFDVEMMRARVEETWSTPRLMSVLLGAFSSLALVLAVVGLYGVMAYNGLRRTREIGIRLALGARRDQISAMMLSQGMRLLLVGLAIGVAAAFAISRLLRSQLFGVGADDLSSYLLVSLVLSVAATLACWIPARRAARVDPMITLRAE
jgi:putative ABC transport system permease protein